MKKKNLKNGNEMSLMDKMTNTEINKIKGGKVKIEGSATIKISNMQ